MNADRKYLFQCVCGSMGTNHARFDRPRSPALGISTLAHGQRSVLMPHNQSVRAGKTCQTMLLETERRLCRGDCSQYRAVLNPPLKPERNQSGERYQRKHGCVEAVRLLVIQ